MKTAWEHIEDVEVWKLFIAGERDAFREVYRRFYPLLKSYSVRMTGDEELVRDTIQNLFVKMIQNCHNLHPTDNVCFYLLCAFRHKLTDAFRSLRFTEHIEDCPDYFYFEADYVEDPFGEDVATDRERQLRQALARLTGRQREVLYLYYIKNMSHHEIATLLGMAVQSSKNLLSRTMVRLREMMTG